MSEENEVVENEDAVEQAAEENDELDLSQAEIDLEETSLEDEDEDESE